MVPLAGAAHSAAISPESRRVAMEGFLIKRFREVGMFCCPPKTLGLALQIRLFRPRGATLLPWMASRPPMPLCAAWA